MNLVLTNGKLVHTHPELIQQSSSRFQSLPVDRLMLSSQEFRWPPKEHVHSANPPKRAPRLSKLHTFLRVPHYQSAAEPEPIPISVARGRCREVQFDRSYNPVSQIDIEANEMADCVKRHESFNKSEAFKGTVYALQLAQLGFYFVGDRSAVGKVRCSFCRHTLNMFTQADASVLHNNFERLLENLIKRHSLLSGSDCPFKLGLNGDDKRFSDDDMARAIGPLVRTDAIQECTPNLSSTPNLDLISIQNSFCELTFCSPAVFPPIDGDDAERYYEFIAQHEDMFPMFDSESDIIAVHKTDREDSTPGTPIDALIGDAPKTPIWYDMWIDPTRLTKASGANTLSRNATTRSSSPRN